MSRTCECGCGEAVEKRFVAGHYKPHPRPLGGSGETIGETRQGRVIADG